MRESIFHRRWLLWMGLAMLVGVLMGHSWLNRDYRSIVAVIIALGIAMVMWRWTWVRCVTITASIALGAWMSGQTAVQACGADDHFDLDDRVRVEKVTTKDVRQQVVVSFQKGYELHKAILFVREQAQVAEGDWLALDVRLRRPSGPRQPGGFDYAAYLARMDIRWMGYVDADELHVVSSGAEATGFIRSIRNWTMDRIAASHDDMTAGLLKGILLGDKSSMSPDERERYARSGIAYVFAVSGMHVGLLYMMLIFGVKRYRFTNRWTEVLIPLSAVTVIWIFIMMVGCTASAVRAGLMLTLYELGRVCHRRVDKWQILGASLVMAILSDPQVVMDIGCQFSYAALAGIFLCFGQIRSWWPARLKHLSWLWTLVAISLSAQAGVLPLSIFYFGGFSPWFWLTGLVAVLVVTANFYLGVLSILIGELPVLSQVVSWLVSKLFGLLDVVIAQVLSWPAGYLTFNLNWGDVVQLYLIVGLVITLFMFKRKRMVRIRQYALSVMAISMLWSPVVQNWNSESGFIYEKDDMVYLSPDGVHVRGIRSSQKNIVLRHPRYGVMTLVNDPTGSWANETGAFIWTSGHDWREKRDWQATHRLELFELSKDYITLNHSSW